MDLARCLNLHWKKQLYFMICRSHIGLVTLKFRNHSVILCYKVSALLPWEFTEFHSIPSCWLSRDFLTCRSVYYGIIKTSGNFPKWFLVESCELVVVSYHRTTRLLLTAIVWIGNLETLKVPKHLSYTNLTVYDGAISFSIILCSKFTYYNTDLYFRFLGSKECLK